MTTPLSTDEPAPGTGSESAPGTGPEQTTGAPTSSLEERAMAALRRAIALENAAIWAYGLISAYAPQDAAVIETNRNNHIFLRDAALARVIAAGGRTVQPQAAYHTPFDIVDLDSARRLARVAEDDCARGWRATVAATDDNSLRVFAAGGLSDCAVRLALLRQAAGMAEITEPFPGSPT